MLNRRFCLIRLNSSVHRIERDGCDEVIRHNLRKKKIKMTSDHTDTAIILSYLKNDIFDSVAKGTSKRIGCVSGRRTMQNDRA